MDDDVVPDDHPRIDDHPGIDYAVLSDPGFVANVHVLVYPGVVADIGMMANVAVASQIHLLAELRRKEEGGTESAVTSGRAFLGCGIFQELGDGLIRIFNPHHRGRYGLLGFKILVYQEYACLAAIDELLIFWISEKTKLSGLPMLDLRERSYLGGRIPVNGSLEQLGKLFGCQLHIRFLSMFKHAKLVFFHVFLNFSCRFLHLKPLFSIFAAEKEIGAARFLSFF